MACITQLEQNIDRTWEGRSLRTGEIRKFNTLADYTRYTASLEKQGTYCAEVDPHYTAAYKPGTNTTATGFMEFQVRDPATQAKYSAMSPAWEGVESSDASIARGDYSLDSAEKTREDLRAKKPQPVLQMPQASQTSPNCVVQ